MRIAHVCLSLGVVLMLAACGGRTVYLHPERTAQDEEKDYYECSFEAQKSTGNLEDSGDREDRVKEMIDSCMRSKGYSR